MKPLVRSLNPLPFALSSLLPPLMVGLSINSTLKMYFFMTTSKKLCTWNNPLGFQTLSIQTMCQLHKAIYGLKNKLTVLILIVYVPSFSKLAFLVILLNLFFFFLDSSSHIILLLVYVDDIIVTSNNSSLFSSLITTLQNFLWNTLVLSTIF